MQHNWQQFRHAPGRRAFTLVEMLTVLGIISVVLLIAVPTFKTLIGNNSLASAQNVISATMATARADAVYNREVTGILFFVDPKTGNAAMAEVQADSSYTPTNLSPDNTTSANNGTVTALELVNYPQTTGGTTSFVYYRDVVLLPAGVGVALDNNSYGFKYDSGNPTYQPFDRYVRFGAIMFDANGTLTAIPYAIPQSRAAAYASAPYAPGSGVNQLGFRLGLRGSSDPNPTGDIASRMPNPINHAPSSATTTTQGYPLISQIGLLLYDRNVYLNQHCGKDGTRLDDGASFNELDFQCALPGQTPLACPPAATGSPPTQQQGPDKDDEEQWLDQNGTSILISQFNGDLIKTK